MTEYGRGYGSQPWHPEDPLYGDQGGWQDPYGGGQHQAPQQQNYAEAPQYDAYGYGQEQATGQQFPHYAQQPHQPQQGYDPSYADHSYGGPSYGDPSYGEPSFGGQHQGQYDTGQGAYAGGWDPAQGDGQGYDPAYGMGATDPYGIPPVGPEHPEHHEPDPQGYPYPERQHPQGGPGPDPETGWDPGPDRGEHAFFAGGDEDGDDGDDVPEGKGKGRGGRTRRGGGTKRRSGCAVFAMTAVVIGGVGAVGYFGYDFYQSRFAAPPDYAGKGSGEVTVEIPDNSTISDMGNALKSGGVVKSHDAFVAAATEGGGDRIQSGTYTMRKQMAASEAVKLMLDPASQNVLIVPEGARNAQVYSMIDDKIGLKDGTTAKVAEEKSGSLGLPSWSGGSHVKDPLEGFLYPSRYTVGEDATPEDVLKQMVTRAEKRYESIGIADKAKSVGLDSPFEVLSVASLVQAEGRTHDDFRKMSEVVYNRLEPGNTETNGMLEFDSTYNYVKNQSEIDLTVSELRNYNNRYNTYFYKGLPPGPIGNPGDDALKAAVNPDDGGWFYFISLDNKTSQFTKTYKEHEKLVEKFRKIRQGK
ncbi:endolytic transglycosylase MltG [Streptomyces sp. HNM0574]|uniref:endolytic transglycosylase MltG n=1 Tax=Streptomyces sp. HNM0574 TaxID=2714954 RepID=UPI00146B6182|nr:endolytic transglycosylase MltG [Streptomyces sp. HNM0574]NLU66350.1 endolytic transglycosylase MltG [Streptomyces sp. HNM0574]